MQKVRQGRNEKECEDGTSQEFVKPGFLKSEVHRTLVYHRVIETA